MGHLVACNADESGSREWVVEDERRMGMASWSSDGSGEVSDVGCDACGHGRGCGRSSFPFEEEGCVWWYVRRMANASVWMERRVPWCRKYLEALLGDQGGGGVVLGGVWVLRVLRGIGVRRGYGGYFGGVVGSWSLIPSSIGGVCWCRWVVCSSVSGRPVSACDECECFVGGCPDE